MCLDNVRLWLMCLVLPKHKGVEIIMKMTGGHGLSGLSCDALKKLAFWEYG